MLVKVKVNIIVQRKDGKGGIKLNASKQLSHFLNSYAQSYNAAYSRHGKLFEEPFKRKIVDSESYCTSLVCYIHLNPQEHHFVHDFRDREFTSWNAIVSNTQTFISKEKVIEWFGSIENLKNAHLGRMPLNNISDLIIE